MLFKELGYLGLQKMILLRNQIYQMIQNLAYAGYFDLPKNFMKIYSDYETLETFKLHPL